MADQSAQLKSITDKLEASYQALRIAAGNIAGLLQLGKATCAEVRAYNLWALAIYNTQQGMLDSLRAGGETNVPSAPTYPTVFAWNGVSGEAALNITCNDSNSLSGLMGAALAGPSTTNPYLSTKEVRIVTQDQYLYNPEKSPSFSALLDVQAQRTQQMQGLGIAWAVAIVICAIIVAVGGGLYAIMQYLETSKIQEANTEQVRQQATAFATYTNARLSCYQDCTARGQSTDSCVSTCQGLVKEPKITLPGAVSSWGFLQWTGFVVVVGAVGVIGYKAWDHHRSGGSYLPELSGLKPGERPLWDPPSRGNGILTKGEMRAVKDVLRTMSTMDRAPSSSIVSSWDPAMQDAWIALSRAGYAYTSEGRHPRIYLTDSGKTYARQIDAV